MPAGVSRRSCKAANPPRIATCARAGLGRPERLRDGGLGVGNQWIAKALIEAIEKARQPLGSMYDGGAALEMIGAVYESHRLRGRVGLPLKNRQHPLTML